jgi:hypothetical protein
MLGAFFVEQDGGTLFQSSLLVRIRGPAGFHAGEAYHERRQAAESLEKA